MRHGNMDDFNVLWNKYKQEQISSEQVLILNALGCATGIPLGGGDDEVGREKDEDVLAAVLDAIMSSEVRLQDKRAAITAAYTNTEANLYIVYEYIRDRYAIVHDAFGGSKSDVISLFAAMAERFTNVDQVNNFDTVTGVNYPYFGDSLKTVIEDAKANLEWIEKYVPEIIAFIDAY